MDGCTSVRRDPKPFHAKHEGWEGGAEQDEVGETRKRGGKETGEEALTPDTDLELYVLIHEDFQLESNGRNSLNLSSTKHSVTYMRGKRGGMGGKGGDKKRKKETLERVQGRKHVPTPSTEDGLPSSTRRQLAAGTYLLWTLKLIQNRCLPRIV